MNAAAQVMLDDRPFERMVTVDTGLIRNTIQLAKQDEEISCVLAEQLTSSKTHRSIQSRETDCGTTDSGSESGNESLYEFAVRYIELVPDLFDYALAAAERADIVKLVLTYLERATEYFLAPRKSTGVDMIGLLGDAYLAHRLIEELNDQIEFILGVPLVHFDMMQANLIIHDLIGDAFANELDKVAAASIESDELSHTIAAARIDTAWVNSLKTQRRAVSGEPVFCFASELGTGLGVPG